MEFMPMEKQILLEILFKLGMAIMVGGIIGGEREYKNKAAGFRTIILICLGSTLISAISTHLPGVTDPGRIMANIVTGIGFLGAGIIFRESGRVIGLTTASTIWMTAAIGMAIGTGLYEFALIATALVMVILIIFTRIEVYIDRIQDYRVYEIDTLPDHENVKKIETMFKECNLKVSARKQTKHKDSLVTLWEAVGKPESHDMFIEKLFNEKDFEGFNY